MSMPFQKRGEGSVRMDEDVQKTASAEETPQDRQERLAALAEENTEADR